MRCQSTAPRIKGLDGFRSCPKTRFLSPNSRINFMMIDIRYERGVYLPQQDVWLDPRDAKRFAFVSHAHSDHIAPHEEIIVSEQTARLMQARLPGRRKTAGWSCPRAQHRSKTATRLRPNAGVALARRPYR